MSRAALVILTAVLTLIGASVHAQQTGWVQIEARPNEPQAVERATTRPGFRT